jgi:fatty acid desaturase
MNIKIKIMKKEDLFKSRAFKILLPVLATVIAVALWRNGYKFGQWLNTILN